MALKKILDWLLEGDMEDNTTKLEYDPPVLTVHGSVEEITLAQSCGTTLDAIVSGSPGDPVQTQTCFS